MTVTGGRGGGGGWLAAGLTCVRLPVTTESGGGQGVTKHTGHCETDTRLILTNIFSVKGGVVLSVTHTCVTIHGMSQMALFTHIYADTPAG